MRKHLSVRLISEQAVKIEAGERVIIDLGLGRNMTEIQSQQACTSHVQKQIFRKCGVPLVTRFEIGESGSTLSVCLFNVLQEGDSLRLVQEGDLNATLLHFFVLEASGEGSFRCESMENTSLIHPQNKLRLVLTWKQTMWMWFSTCVVHFRDLIWACRVMLRWEKSLYVDETSMQLILDHASSSFPREAAYLHMGQLTHAIRIVLKHLFPQRQLPSNESLHREAEMIFDVVQPCVRVTPESDKASEAWRFRCHHPRPVDLTSIPLSSVQVVL